MNGTLHRSGPGSVEPSPEPASTARTHAQRGICGATFGLVLTRIEEAMTGERRPDGAATAAILLERLELVSGSSAPAAVRMARTPAELHTRLLDWQDQIELRDGASRHESEAKRLPNVIGLGGGTLRLSRFTLPAADRRPVVRRQRRASGSTSGRSAA
jgi:hypothetical protein